MRTLAHRCTTNGAFRLFNENELTSLDSVVPGGGVEPPRPEGRRILSPLRLPVPPSRLYLQVPDFTAYFTFYVFFIQDNGCETVQANVEVFMDFHRSLSLAGEVLCGSPSGNDVPWPSDNEDVPTRFYHPTHSQPHL